MILNGVCCQSEQDQSQAFYVLCRHKFDPDLKVGRKLMGNNKIMLSMHNYEVREIIQQI
jgi:hypothetical protein